MNRAGAENRYDSCFKHDQRPLSDMTDSGKNTDAELRHPILKRISGCRCDECRAECPFRLLRKISHAFCVSLILAMDRMTPIKLFNVECRCVECSYPFLDAG